MCITLSALGYAEDALVNYGLAVQGYEENLGIHHRLTPSTINKLGILFAELK